MLLNSEVSDDVQFLKVSACKAFSNNYKIVLILLLSFHIRHKKPFTKPLRMHYCTKFSESSGHRLINFFGGQNGNLKILKAAAC